jgi:hypothetical protein
MNDSGSQFDSDDGETYAEERTRRRLRTRRVQFAVFIALWLLSLIPLARLSSDEGGGVGVAAIYLAAGLGLAIVIRGVYARARKRQFWSPSVFLIAAFLAIMSYVVQSAGEEVASPGIESGVADEGRTARPNGVAS